MGRARRTNCRLCMKPTNKGDTTTLNNLPKTFAHILEEMSGIKFTQADGLHMAVCVRCRDFLQAMEHHSQYPKSNKISGAGKKKVRRLMDKGFSASEAIEKVIAEKRARDLLAGVVQQTAPVIAPQVQVVQQLIGQNANVAPPGRMSGAQRKKLSILIAGGMDRVQARKLVLAASNAMVANQPQQQRGPAQRGNLQGGVQRGVVQQQRGAVQGQRAAAPGQRAPGQKRVVPQSGVIAQKGAPQRPAGQKGAAQRGAPVKGVAQRQSNGSAVGQRAPNQKNQVAQKAPVATAVAQKRQANANGGRTLNSEKRLGAYAAPRRNDRPVPYQNNTRGGNNNRQQGGQQNQQQRNDNFNQQQQQQCPLEVGIVPINFPNVQLDEMKLDALKEAITNEIFKIPQGGPLIRFLGTSSQNGWLKLICADELSHNWLSMLVARWERAGLRMVEGNSLPQPVVLSLYLPGDFRSPDEILNILERQNNSLNTNQWRVINRETDANGQSITVCVDEQSFQALQSRDFMVFLGLGVVELKPRRFPSDGGSFNSSSSNIRNNNAGSSNNSKGYSNGNIGGGNGGGGSGNNYQSNRSNNSGGGGGSYQRQGQGYQRPGYQSQRAW